MWPAAWRFPACHLAINQQEHLTRPHLCSLTNIYSSHPVQVRQLQCLQNSEHTGCRRGRDGMPDGSQVGLSTWKTSDTTLSFLSTYIWIQVLLHTLVLICHIFFRIRFANLFVEFYPIAAAVLQIVVLTFSPIEECNGRGRGCDVFRKMHKVWKIWSWTKT